MRNTKAICCILLSTFLLAACGNGNGNGDPICGDDIIQAGEDCDKTRLNGKTCADFEFNTGTLACDADCHFDTSGCENVTDDCGNGDIDSGEDCDGDNLNDTTCEDLGYIGGELGCTGCAFDESACEPDPCGDGEVGAGEECDGDDLDGITCELVGFPGGVMVCTDACTRDASGCTGCTDDASEENDDLAGAAAITEGSHALQMCNTGGEEDWFTLDLVLDDVLVVETLVDDTFVDIDLELTDAEGLLLASSSNAGSDEELSYTATADGSYLLRIFPYDDRPGAMGYSLVLTLNPECQTHEDCAAGEVCEAYACVAFVCSDEDPCPDDLVCDAGACVECATAADCPEEDAYYCDNNLCIFDCNEDAYEPNSTDAEAAAISVGFTEAGLTLCGMDDADWFQIDLEELHLYDLTVNFSHANGDIDVEVFEAADMEVPVAVGYSNDDDELVTIALGTGEAGSYLIAVRQGHGELVQTYYLELTDGGAVTCAWDSDCAEGELCLENQCVTPDCIEDEDCTAPQICWELACHDRAQGDTCDDPFLVENASGVFAMDLAPRRNDVAFEPGTCTEWGTAGKDVIFQVDLTAGQQLWATVLSDFDAALVVLSECVAAPPADACLAGADEYPAGVDVTEDVHYQADVDRTVYVVVDTFAPGYPDEDDSFSLFYEIE